jgi:hypothetical protein
MENEKKSLWLESETKAIEIFHSIESATKNTLIAGTRHSFLGEISSQRPIAIRNEKLF